MEQYILIGCGKTKLTRPAPARDLYVGSLFKARRQYAEGTGHPWGILSALHGLVMPTDWLEPYDRELEPHSTFWASRVLAQLTWRWKPEDGVIELHAGQHYRDPLASYLRDAGYRVIAPTAGMGIGHQLGYYARWRRALAS